MFAADLDRGKHGAHRLEHVIDLALVADGIIGVFDADVGRADEDLAVQRKENADPAVFVFVKELVAGGGREQLGMIDDQVRAFGPADETGRLAECGVGKIDPRAGGVDYDSWGDREIFAGDLVAQRHSTVRGRGDGGDVVKRLRAGVGGEGVVDQFEAKPLGQRNPRVVVGGGADDAGVQQRAGAERGRATGEGVGGQHAVARGEEIVERETDFHQSGAALGGFRRAVEKLRGGVGETGPAGENRNRRRQRLDGVRGVFEEAIAFVN